MSREIPWEILHKSLNRTIEADEQILLEKWLSESDENQKVFEELKITWNISGSQFDHFHPDKELAWKKISKMAGIDNHSKVLPIKKQQPTVQLLIRNVAAIFIGLLLLSLAFWFYQNNVTEQIEITEVSTEFGQRSSFKLDDGTQVWLNSGSKILKMETDQSDHVQLNLIGEAYFEVPENRAGTFTVTTSYMDIVVTGTSFNVRAYPDEFTIETILDKGEVKLYKTSTTGDISSHATILRPSEKAVFDTVNQNLNISETRSSEHNAWRHGHLAFRNVDFDGLASRLEKWYDITITYDSDSFEDATYTGTFRNNESITQVLESIRFTTPFTYEVKDNEIIIIN